MAGQRWKFKSVISVDPDLVGLLHKDITGEERIAAHDFFLALAACNTVIPVPSKRSSVSSDTEVTDEVDTIDYQGESPDEQALVTAASAYGYTLIERTSGHIVIDVHGEKLRLDVLGLHEFDSVRKRMSVVIRFQNNAVKVLVKGADSSMLSILDTSSNNHQGGVQAVKIKHATESHLTGYSSQGLRTLVIASRDLTDTEFEEWKNKYETASTLLTKRSAKLRQAASLIECHLNLLGATGIEDKLQEGVPETIESLRQAGIKVWVLTGDKQETAISIGLSCKLLTENKHQIIINGTSEVECRHLLADAKAKYGIKSADYMSKTLDLKLNTESDFLESDDNSTLSIGSVPEIRSQILKHADGTNDLTESVGEKVAGSAQVPLALIIDGNSLVYILEKELEGELFDLGTSCRVVLCCRVASLQKAGIVDLIKSRTNEMTLAIEDGANDVSMIQMADVGVGICGQEGRQAVMASDFSMGQFRFLKRLLLVHGHWNYQRIGYLILYNFYRNAVFVLMLVHLIHSFFHNFPFDRLEQCILFSHLYITPYYCCWRFGQGFESEDPSPVSKTYNMRLFWLIMLDTLWQSLVLFYIPVFTYRSSTLDIWSMGSLWTISVVILVNIHLVMDIQCWVFFTHIATWGSIVVTYTCMIILDSIPVFPNYGTIYHLAVSETYWRTILLIITVALLPRLLYKVYQQRFWPSDIHIVREAEILRKLPNQDTT